MRSSSSRSGSALLAAALAVAAAGPAAADLSAAQVSADWQARIVESGGSLSVGRQFGSEGRVMLRDLVFEIALPQGRLTASISHVAVSEQEDGSVLITAAPDMMVSATTATPFAGRAEAVFDVTLPGLRDLATGTDDDTTFTLEAPLVSATLRSASLNGAPVDLQLAAALAGLRLSREVQEGAVSAEFTADDLSLEMEGSGLGPSGAGLSLSALFAELHATLATTAPGTPELSFETGLRHGAAQIDAEWRDPEDGALNVDLSATAGAQVNEQRTGRVQHSGGLSGLDITASGPRLSALDLPEGSVTGQLDRLAFGISAPAAPGTTPEPFNLFVNLSGLAPGDALWALADPDKALPREGADLRMDIAGTMGMDSDGSATLHTLDVNTLTVDFADTFLDAYGGLRFEPGAPLPAPELPPAEGILTFRLDGANALMEQLVQSGLLGQGQALGAQLMMGFFAAPNGEDSLKTTLEFTPDGRITANGQGLR